MPGIVALFLLALATPPLPGPESSPATEAATPAVIRGTVEYRRSIDRQRLDALAKPRSIWGKLVEWVAGAAERPHLVRPFAITEDSRGRLIIADPGQGVVHLLDLEKPDYEFISGAKHRPFQSPVGVAVDGQDNIYVSDSALGEVQVFDRRRKPLRSIRQKDSRTPLQRPTGIAIEPRTRRLFVADTLLHQVLVFDLQGHLLHTIGHRGTEAGEFNFPTFLTVAAGKLYVVDAMNFRIQIFSLEGQVIGGFGRLGNQSGSLNRPKGIAVDSDGNIYVVDALFETVQVFDGEGRLLYYFGSSGAAPGQFGLPSGIYINPRDLILIADSYNGRVQVFRYRREAP